MGTTNNGSQIFTFGYQQSGTTTIKNLNSFNKLTYKLFSPGVVQGGTFTKVDDATISIAPMVYYMEDPSNLVGVRMETLGTATVAVTNSATYIVARYNWPLISSQYTDFLAIDYSALQTGDIILGKVNYNDTTLSVTFDYSMKQWSQLYYSKTNQGYPNFWVTATAPYSTSVKVYPGKAVVGGKIVQINTATNSPAFSFPVSTNGRTDILVLNSSGSLAIIQGEDTSGAPTPNIPINVLPLAKINFSATSSGYNNVVQGNFIEFLDPTNNPIINDANTTVEATNCQTVKSITPTTVGLNLLSASTTTSARSVLELDSWAQRSTLTSTSTMYTFTNTSLSQTQTSAEANSDIIILSGTVGYACSLTLYKSSLLGSKKYTVINSLQSGTNNLMVSLIVGSNSLTLPIHFTSDTLVTSGVVDIYVNSEGTISIINETPLVATSARSGWQRYKIYATGVITGVGQADSLSTIAYGSVGQARIAFPKYSTSIGQTSFSTSIQWAVDATGCRIQNSPIDTVNQWFYVHAYNGYPLASQSFTGRFIWESTWK